MSEHNTDKLKLETDNRQAEFSAISPLEPLDPNKFRNIMLDKQEINVQQNQNREIVYPQSSTTSDYPTQNTEIQVQDGKKYQIQQNPQTFAHTQNVETSSNQFMHHQHQLIQQHLQHPIHQNPPQYYSHQPMQFPSQQYGISSFPAGMQSSNQNNMPVIPQMTQAHAQSQQQHSNYFIHGQQPQWIHHQPPQHNPQLYNHNSMQGRICSPQQHPTIIKQLPPPPYNMAATADSTNPHVMNPFAPQQHQVSQQIVQRQISQQEFNYPLMTPQTPHQHVHQYGPGIVPYCFRGIESGGHGQNIFSNQNNIVLQSPMQIKKSQPDQQVRPPPHQIHPIMGQQRPQMLRMPMPMHHQPSFVGHEPAIAATLNPDVCLAGCVFLLIDDCNNQKVDSSLLPNLIRFYGGDIEPNNPRGIPERITHIVCSSWLDNEPIIQQALAPGFIDRIPRKMKRIVTVSWLNNAIEKRRVDPPTNASHIPSFWSVGKQNQQIAAKTISIFGFSAQDANVLKYMIEVTGAKFGSISSKTDFIILNKSERSEEIIQKAAENNIQLVNFQWLFELYFGTINILSMNDAQRFLPENENNINQITMSPQNLAKTSEFCHKLMLPWTQPIILNDEILKAAYELKKNIADDTNIFSEKLFSIKDNAPTEEQIKQASSLLAAYNGKQNQICVMIEGLYPAQIENLSKKVRFLGGRIAKNISECTHFVTTNLRKSVHLIQAISKGLNIVNPLWIETSFTRLEYIDPLIFFVKDRDNERKCGYNLMNTILMTRNRRIFQGVKFHLSPSVQPSYETLKNIVEFAGGETEEAKLKKKELLKCIQENKTYFIICNRNDLNLYQYLVNCNFPLFNEDFVIMSILRHKIDHSFNGFHTYPSNALPIPAGNKR